MKSLEDLCLLCVLQNLEIFSTDSLLKLPCSLWYQLVKHLSIVEIWTLEKRGAMKKLNMDAVWKGVHMEWAKMRGGHKYFYAHNIVSNEDYTELDENLRHSFGGEFTHMSYKQFLVHKLMELLNSTTGTQLLHQTSHETIAESARDKMLGILFFSRDSFLKYDESGKTGDRAKKQLASALRTFSSRSKIANAIEIVIFILELMVKNGFYPTGLMVTSGWTALWSILPTELVDQLARDVTDIRTDMSDGKDVLQRVLSNPASTLRLWIDSDNVIKAQELIDVIKAQELINATVQTKSIVSLSLTFSHPVSARDLRILLEKVVRGGSHEDKSKHFHLRHFYITMADGADISDGKKERKAITFLLQSFIQQEQFKSLTTFNVLTTSMACELIWTFLSTPCTAPQYLTFDAIETNTIKKKSLPADNDFYRFKNLSLNSKKNRTYDGLLIGWMMGLPRLKVGSLEINTNYGSFHHVTVPVTACLQRLQIKALLEDRFDASYLKESIPFITSVLGLPVLQEFSLYLKYWYRSGLWPLGRENPSCFHNIEEHCEKLKQLASMAANSRASVAIDHNKLDYYRSRRNS